MEKYRLKAFLTKLIWTMCAAVFTCAGVPILVIGIVQDNSIALDIVGAILTAAAVACIIISVWVYCKVNFKIFDYKDKHFWVYMGMSYCVIGMEDKEILHENKPSGLDYVINTKFEGYKIEVVAYLWKIDMKINEDVIVE